jgi:hypothetical protein
MAIQAPTRAWPSSRTAASIVSPGGGTTTVAGPATTDAGAATSVASRATAAATRARRAADETLEDR